MSAVVIALQTQTCWPWAIRFLADGEEHPRGGACSYCRRDVALTLGAGTARPVCIYCALDRGIVPELDVPIMEETHDAA